MESLEDKKQTQGKWKRGKHRKKVDWDSVLGTWARVLVCPVDWDSLAAAAAQVAAAEQRRTEDRGCVGAEDGVSRRLARERHNPAMEGCWWMA